MKNEIHKLISLGDTEKALDLLTSRFPNEVTLLKAQYTNGKKEFNLSMMDYSDWQRIQSRVNYSVLELAGRAEDPAPEVPVNQARNTGAKVYITYSPDAGNDRESARRMRDFLSSNNIQVTTNDDLELGGNIEDFVNSSIREADFILAVISKESLRSSWQNGEAALDIVLERVAETRVIPVSLDRAILEADFYFESLDFLNANIKKAQKNVQKAITLGGDSRHFQVDLNRLNNAKNQLSLIIEKMKNVRMVSLNQTQSASDQEFEEGMRRIVQRLQPANP